MISGENVFLAIIAFYLEKSSFIPPRIAPLHSAIRTKSGRWNRNFPVKIKVLGLYAEFLLAVLTGLYLNHIFYYTASSEY